MTSVLFIAPTLHPALRGLSRSAPPTRRARSSFATAPLRARASLSCLNRADDDRSACASTSSSSTALARPTSRTRARRIRALVTAALALTAAATRTLPLLAAVTSGSTAAALVEVPGGFMSGVTASLALVLASEIGDKTFFISALLSMKYGRLLVLLGTMLALGSMTVISVGIGQLLHAVPTTLRLGIPLDDYAAILLLLYFGVQNIREGLRMSGDEAEELEGAKQVVESDNKAEWGDKSMLATVALAAAKSPLGVIVGGVTGHLIASIIAVVSGSILGKYISEKNARLFGGVLFLIFAVLTLRGVY